MSKAKPKPDVELLERVRRETDEAAVRAMREASRALQLGQDIAVQLEKLKRAQA